MSKGVGCSFKVTLVSQYHNILGNKEKRIREYTFLLPMIARKFVLCNLNM